MSLGSVTVLVLDLLCWICLLMFPLSCVLCVCHIIATWWGEPGEID